MELLVCVDVGSTFTKAAVVDGGTGRKVTCVAVDTVRSPSSRSPGLPSWSSPRPLPGPTGVAAP